MATLSIAEQERITPALIAILNEYPDLEGETVRLADNTQTDGIVLYPTAGAVIVAQREDILGGIEQTCRYPATLIYKVSKDSPANREEIKEFLDAMGAWLERLEVAETISNITSGAISRTSPAFVDSVDEAGTEYWRLDIELDYTNARFERS